MLKHMNLLRIVLLIAVAWGAPYGAAAQDAAVIPEREIAELREGLVESGGNKSHVARRRALKNLVRKGEALINAAPGSQSRFAVLELILMARKKLLSIENSDSNRDGLFRTCEELVKAPDEYAAARLQADLMLSEKRLAASNATMAERAEDLARLIQRYAGTEAEAKSLMMASLIAKKLESRDLEYSIKQAMDERFQGDHEMIAFRRQHNVHRLDSTFTGEYERLDGTRISFPLDVMGQMSFVVFWSKGDSDSEALLEKIKEYENQYSGRINVFSFNIDELPDAGKSVLKKHGLDWTVMKLPGGRKNSAYRAYARNDAVALFVNAYGRVILKPAAHFDATGWRSEKTAVYSISGDRISGERYLAQLQWLLSGEFLAEELPLTKDTKEGLFVPPPFRYRMGRDEVWAMYERAADGQGGDRVIGLLGMWKLRCEPEYLEKAVAAAEELLGKGADNGKSSQEGREVSGRADIIARFCLAKAELRESMGQGAESAESVVEGFFEACGGSNRAPAAAVAAAAVLAIDAGSLEQHDSYRGLFLERHSDDPEFHAFASFLRDRLHRFRLLMPNHTKRERWVRGRIVEFGGEPMTNRLPEIELTQLDGKPLVLPKKDTDKMTILMFIEPLAGAETDFPIVLDSHGRTNHDAVVHGMMTFGQLFVDKHINDGIELIAAFICDDAARVGRLMATNNWTCQAALVPGGLENPMVNRLGLLSADKFPNVFLLRRDGTVAWWATGMPYREFARAWVHHLGMKVHIEQCDLEYGYGLLEKGDFKEAARIFSGPFLPWRPDRYGWRPVRYHGRAVALMELKEWDAALAAIDKAIDAHKGRHYRGPRSGNIEDWQKDVADFEMEQPCNVVLGLWEAKAVILDELGRDEDARALRARLQGGGDDPILHDDIYQRFHLRLEEWRAGRGPAAQGADR